MAAITDVPTLQARVGVRTGPRDFKVIRSLDHNACEWLEHTRVAFLAFSDRGRLALTTAAAQGCLMRATNPSLLSIDMDQLDDAHAVRAGAGFGSLLLVPGLSETLRINGRVEAVSGDRVHVAIQECYLHCSKALVRSEFWEATGREGAAGRVDQFIQECRFMALATVDAEGHVDVSPKGEPAGALLHRYDGALWYPDRPGNRRADSFRNLLSHPWLAALALVPGSARSLQITGTATIEDPPADLTALAVEESAPTLATRIDGACLQIRDSPSLAGATVWPSAPPPPSLDPAFILREHIRLSQSAACQSL